MGGGDRVVPSIFSKVLVLIEGRLTGQIPEHCSEDQLEQAVSSAFKTVGKDDEVADAVRELLGKGEKSRDMSIAAREEGNKQFQAGKLRESLACYNTAVLSGPWPSDEAVMALGNRAAVLGKMKKNKRVVDDLILALDSGYPCHLHYKAWQRLAVAYEGLGLTTNAKEAYERLLEVLDYSDIPTDKVGKMRKDATMALKTLIVEEEEETDKDEVLPLLSQNSDFPTLSHNVEVKESLGQGRFLVARETIEPGEVVSREEALAVSLDPIHRAEQCTHCLRHALAPLPCPSCSIAAFCCRECREAGLVSHAFTCRLMANPSLSTVTSRSDEDTTRLLLTLRILTSRPLSFHLEYFNSWSSASPTPPKSFAQVLHLVKHLPHLLLSHHLASVFLLLYLLRAVSYIPPDSPTEQEHQLCLLTSHIHAAIKPNIHASFQAGVRGDKLNQEYLGVALFPTVASCFNHSCDPNTFVIDIGRIQVTVASRRIFEGEEVSQGYGGHFGDTVLDKRQKLLCDRYRFTCQCEACTEDWPLTASLLDQSTTFSDAPTNLLKQRDCVNCEALDAKNELLRDRVEAELGRGRVSSAISLTCDRVRLSSDNLKRPHVLHIMGRLALVQYFWAVCANRGSSWRPIRLPLYY